MTNRTPNGLRGYALPVVMIASFVAATVTAAYIIKAKASSESTAQLLRQRQTFYAADGMSRMVVKEVESYLMDTLDIAALDLTDPENIPPPTLPGYTLENYEILSDTIPFDGPIPSGLFEGLHARQTPFSLHILARHDKTGAASEVNLQVILGQIGLFQFFLFSDDYTELYPGPDMTIPEGRIHINGDLCIASHANLRVDRLTSSGIIRPGSAGCRREVNGAVQISDGFEYRRLDWDNAYGCTDCDGSELSWTPYAISRWKGHLRDRTHGVRPLRLPITTSPFVQAGQDADKGLMLNNNNSRTLVDPVLPTDGDDVLEQKFAAQADIRILNGVWYINDGTWPGEPIWSDHPGTFAVNPTDILHSPLGLLPTWAFETVEDTLGNIGNGNGNSDSDDDVDEDADEDVDEDADEDVDVPAVEIASAPAGAWGYWGPLPVGVESDGPESWTLEDCVRVTPGNNGQGNAYGLNKHCDNMPLGYVPPPDTSILVGQGDLAASKEWEALPRRFSHYDWDPTTEDLVADGTGVISYGTLFRDGTSWRPGFWGAGPGGATWTDSLGIPQPYFCDQCNGGPCTEGNALRDASVPFCQGTEYSLFTDSLGAQYLQGTRGGFIDQRIDSGDSGKGKILPMNFDVAEFTAAMSDTTPGELGSYFNGGATFNGLIYISSSWEGAMDGLPDGLATLWPTQGDKADVNQAPTWGAAMVQDALPHPLCSHTKGVIPAVQRIRHSGPEADLDLTDGHETWFSIPSCDPVVNDLGHPNAVRIINADVVDDAVFPKGLSITSNLPTYVLGETNTSSDPSAFTAEPWVPFMIGSDAMSLLSNNWDDANAPWDKSKSLSNRRAVDTQFNIEFIGGIVQTVNGSRYSGGVENYPRFLENWGGKRATIRGSFVIGFNSVYARQRWGQGGVYSAPIRDWAFDPHLRVLNNQPPGTPKYSVHSISLMDRL